MQTRWNNLQNGKLPKILFSADRNILADQAYNAFGAFDHNALARINPIEIRKNGGKVPMGLSIYFKIFQTMLCGSDGEETANPDEKSIVFCATQNHAMQIRDMINSQAKRGTNYCVRVTADDGSI